ncbi:MAG: hypothetical protein VX899_10370 [Myxococcota bacterium]|nr:hypothetical protein [Myxococcota bacterium]
MLLLMLACDLGPAAPELQPVPQAARPTPPPPDRGRACWSELAYDHGYGWCVFGPGGARCDEHVPPDDPAPLGLLTDQPVLTGDGNPSGACYVLAASPATVHCKWRREIDDDDPVHLPAFQMDAPVDRVVLGPMQVCMHTASGWSCEGWNTELLPGASEVIGSDSVLCSSNDEATACRGGFILDMEPPSLDQPLRDLSLSQSTLCGTGPDGQVTCIGAPMYFCLPDSDCEKKRPAAPWQHTPKAGALLGAMGAQPGACIQHGTEMSCTGRQGWEHPLPLQGPGLCMLSHCCYADADLTQVRCGHADGERRTRIQIPGCDLQGR